ncbi:MAG: succinate dehydrogenase, cytochrome b556 subunit [Anaerolineaceae bacterium]|nr:succinate dehydrogenase, cytochrome b556 subunit [Anaerolineaceae bacterium]
MINQPSPKKALQWFDPRNKKTGSLAFILNRITALGLTLYLFLHLIMLGKLAQGQEAYDNFIELAHHPFIQIGEMLVIAAGIIHGLNGIRIALNSFGIGTRHQKSMFFGVLVLSIIGTAVFAVKMFFGS